MNKTNDGFSLGSLILGILYLFAGFLSIRNPLASNAFLVGLIVMTAIFDGIFEIALRNRINKYFGRGGGFLLFTGIVNLILAALILFNFTSSVIALPWVFAIYIIFTSITSIIRSFATKEVSNGVFWAQVILNILGIVLGVMLIKNPLASFFTISTLIGFYFFLAGIRNIIFAF
ncbi:MAG: DUF308 domain-containing protein [Anaerococcus sp.]|nr:DUF308 domain-containing protein [Anaerococcus sp.]MDD7044000.1 DUF308 domain-containing protein [Peptoniphilaceae bacterium]MDY2919592.1 DUF308 domain-containing protein [Anaerococcus sp.]